MGLCRESEGSRRSRLLRDAGCSDCAGRGVQGMELQVITSGLERGRQEGYAKSWNNLMSQEAKPSQTPWEPLHNCPKGSY